MKFFYIPLAVGLAVLWLFVFLGPTAVAGVSRLEVLVGLGTGVWAVLATWLLESLITRRYAE